MEREKQNPLRRVYKGNIVLDSDNFVKVMERLEDVNIVEGDFEVYCLEKVTLKSLSIIIGDFITAKKTHVRLPNLLQAKGTVDIKGKFYAPKFKI